ncbi:TetR family transcriptional regulator [Leifsonia sp. ZF2019]|uniref:TetR/AcrR family transcriptional regulator n=1 Tax=Leifsonia sp. ZF2019 TaxID=2781978 RepID=UPI001CBC3115|nr:TetR/AcrR family transcriptional regulator [Leifsonia sp. ZF2019]UAJ79043.1 TetR family transcriptional regulator [Leifsonia sp. ZF2019]
MTGLRQRKRDRTREALVASAVRLFAERGYDGVTVAEIAEEAEVGARTFFAYFASKEDLLFPDAQLRVSAAVDALRDHAPGEAPMSALVRALDSAGVTGSDMTSDAARLRMRLIAESPVVQGRALRYQAEAQDAIARQLRASYPDDYDEVAAAAVVGAFVGAVTAALRAVFDASAGEASPGVEEDRRARVREATERALAPWLHPRS